MTRERELRFESDALTSTLSRLDPAGSLPVRRDYFDGERAVRLEPVCTAPCTPTLGPAWYLVTGGDVVQTQAFRGPGRRGVRSRPGGRLADAARARDRHDVRGRGARGPRRHRGGDGRAPRRGGRVDRPARDRRGRHRPRAAPLAAEPADAGVVRRLRLRALRDQEGHSLGSGGLAAVSCARDPASDEQSRCTRCNAPSVVRRRRWDPATACTSAGTATRPSKWSARRLRSSRVHRRLPSPRSSPGPTPSRTGPPRPPRGRAAAGASSSASSAS